MKTNSLKSILAALTLTVLITLCGCGGSSDDTLQDFLQQTNQLGPGQGGPAPILSFRVVNTFPHQTDAFTQGLVFDNGRLFESTGLVGQSDLREVNLQTGAVVRQQNNAGNVFAEGLALRAGVLYQLTLNSGEAVLWDANSFTQTGTRAIPNPSWGLTLTDQDNFAFSDGTSTIRFLLPTSLEEIGRITVTDDGQEVDLLNELEFIDGLIYANRFTTDEIVAINPSTGVVQFRIDLTGIIDKQANNLGLNDVLNGIAYDPQLNRLFVTGKRWPSLFQIELVQ